MVIDKEILISISILHFKWKGCVLKTEPAQDLKHSLIICLVMLERQRSPWKKRVLSKYLSLLRVDGNKES